MNIAKANNDMKKLFHDGGFTGKDCVIAVIDTVVGDVGKMRSHIEHADQYRVDDMNTEDHASFICDMLNDWAPDATLLSYCVFPNGKGNMTLTNKALEDVILRVKSDPEHQYFVNMSLAGNVGKDYVSPVVAKMRSLIQQLSGLEVPVYVAAGNDGGEQLYIYPSRFQEPVCVAAACSNGSRASFSVFHDQVDFIEWGVEIVGITRFGTPTIMSGTSMACPNALGKAVLLACKMRQDNGLWPTEMQLYNEMCACAIDCETAGYDKKSGFGFVDIRKTDGIYKHTQSQEVPIKFNFYLQSIIDAIKKLFSVVAPFTLSIESTIKYTRSLKQGMSGADVKAAKDRLLELGYLKASTKSTFGSDTTRAVKKFQADNTLVVDGIIGELTWGVLFSEETTDFGAPDAQQLYPEDFPDNISQDHIEALIPELSKVSKKRREFVLRALTFAADLGNLPEYPLCFYIWGANLYNRDLDLNVMSPEALTSYFSKPENSKYFDSGRKEMIFEAAEDGDFQIPGSDCSGTIVGLLRFFKFVDSGFDANADKLYNSYCTPTSSPRPGDFIWKKGHIGIFLGAGLVCECIGGAYGMQITVASDRRVYDFVNRREQRMSDWVAFGAPKWFS